MKLLLIPSCCLLLIGAMLSLVIGHWFQLVQTPTISIQAPSHPILPLQASVPSEPPVLPTTSPPQNEHIPSLACEHDLQQLRNRVSQLETKNQQLLLQLAETNRDLLTLQFRVDTHSESFRPLPVAETTSPPAAIPVQETSADFGSESEDDPTLLPARAEPVAEPSRPADPPQ